MLERIKNAVWAFRNVNLSLQDWAQQLEVMEFGGESSSGVKVSEATATRHATIFACINILSRDMSALPLKMYERKANGGRAEVTSHPVAYWLKEPNALQTPTQWRMRGWFSTLATGNQYDQIITSTDGYYQTVPIDSARILEVKVGGDLSKSYKLDIGNGEHKWLRGSQVLHNFGLSTNGGVTGVSPIRMCMETVGRALALGEYSAAYFRSPVPKVIAKTIGPLKDGASLQKFKDGWTEQFAGKRGLSTIAVMPQGIEIDQIVKIPNNEAQFVETAKFLKEDLAQIYMVPMHRLQALDRATFSNIEHQGLEYVQYALLPWLNAQEEVIERAFLSAEDRERYFIRHNVDGLLRGDFKTRMEGSAMAVQWGLATINERRALENLPAIEGADDLLVPLNMVKLKDLTAPEPPSDTEPPAAADEPADDPQDNEDQRQIRLNRAAGMGEAELRGAISRRELTRRLIPRIERALQREIEIQGKQIRGEGVPLLRFEERNALTFVSWLEEYAKSREANVRAAVAPIFDTLATVIAESANADVKAEIGADQIAPFAARWSELFAASFTTATIRQLQSVALEAQAHFESDPIDEVSRRTEEWEDGLNGKPRAGKDAEREGFKLANGVAALVFTSAGFGLVWATFGRNCPLCSAMRGKRVSGGQAFLEPGEFNPAGAERPIKIKRRLKSPPLHRGCDCGLVPG
jgi:HK97 family phage portal protein